MGLFVYLLISSLISKIPHFFIIYLLLLVKREKRKEKREKRKEKREKTKRAGLLRIDS